jgi:hypothetical protein
MQSSTTSSATPSVSRLSASPKGSRKNRRRGQTTGPAGAAEAAAATSGPGLSGFFRRLSTRTTREMPTIASSHPVSYQSQSSYETLRDLLSAVIAQDTTVHRLKESKFTLQVSCNGSSTTFQDLKFTVE